MDGPANWAQRAAVQRLAVLLDTVGLNSNQLSDKPWTRSNPKAFCLLCSFFCSRPWRPPMQRQALMQPLVAGAPGRRTFETIEG